MEDNFMNVWEKAVDILKDEVSPIAMKTYIEVIVPRLINKNTVCLLCPSSYYVDTIKHRFVELIRNALNYLTSVDYEIVFEVKTTVPENEITDIDDVEIIRGQFGDVESLDGKEKLNPILDIEKIRENAGLNKRYTFDNFIIGNNNRFAQATAYSIKDNLGLTNPLYIYGGVGLGKTHLMQAIGNAVIDEDPSKKVFYCSGKDFV